MNYVQHVKHIYNTEIYNSITLLLLYVLYVWQNQMCIFVRAHFAAAVSIEIIFATNASFVYCVYLDIQCSRELNIIDFNKCCSCVKTFHNSSAQITIKHVCRKQVSGSKWRSTQHICGESAWKCCVVSLKTLREWKQSSTVVDIATRKAGKRISVQRWTWKMKDSPLPSEPKVPGRWLQVCVPAGLHTQNRRRKSQTRIQERQSTNHHTASHRLAALMASPDGELQQL